MDKDLSGKRIDIALMDIRPDLSRRSIKKLIIEGLVTINGETVFANYKVKKGDEVEIQENKAEKFLRSGGGGLVIKPNKHVKFERIYEDEHCIIVNKPSGINSHPVTKRDNDSLLNGIYHHIQVQQKYDKDVRIRLVHRLDKETSGIVIATKSLQANQFYSRQFENRIVEKTYFAIVKRDFQKFLEKKNQPLMTVRTYIGKDNDSGERYRNTDQKTGKLAITKIWFMHHFNKFGKRAFSLVKVKPETGRTHQIRVHLSSIRFPILGDTLYGGQKYKRLMLHAAKLKVRMYPTKDWAEFEAALPEEFFDPHIDKTEYLARADEE